MTLSSERQAKQVAASFRADYRLGVQPLGDLVALIEQTTGYDVAILEGDPDEHGLTMRDPVRGAVFIGIARSRRPMRQRSTLAHELAHVLFEDWSGEPEPEKRKPQEVRADAFARHLLVPVEGLKEFLGDRASVSKSELASVVQRFLVSPAIAAIAMRDAGYVDVQTANNWMEHTTAQLATQFGWSDQYAALQDDSDRLRAPQALVARAVAGYAEGIVSSRVIATLRGVGVDEVLNDLEVAGIVPIRHEGTDMRHEDLPDVDVDLSGLDDEGACS